MRLSVVIPARNEQGSVAPMVSAVSSVLRREGIAYEIIVVDDGSTDSTGDAVRQLSERNPDVHLVVNSGRHGFGMAVRAGLQQAEGDIIAIMMADCSDSPDDLIVCYRKIQEGFDCVFGSRFIAGSSVVDYPVHKLLLNRLANTFIRLLFHISCNDLTNAFKCYRREVIQAMQPLISPHFNLTVEMPLKAVVRGYSYAVIPVSWRNRSSGVSKLKIKEMGSRYLFIVLYLWLEKHLSRGDYHRKNRDAVTERRAPAAGRRNAV